jgi:hypothetical protein
VANEVSRLQLAVGACRVRVKRAAQPDAVALGEGGDNHSDSSVNAS